MNLIACKFGGSSTATPELLRRILHIIKKSPARRCVVLSAPGISSGHPVKVTRLLERCWQLRAAGEDDLLPRRAVIQRFTELSQALNAPDYVPIIAPAIDEALNTSLDFTLSRGEALMAGLFSRFSGISMVDAAEVVTFDREGRLDFPATAERLARAFQGKDRLILPGFYGADPAGRVVTFPKNGSDITGALAAAALNADLYENWTDVPGLMTADPALVPDARPIPHLAYSQMRELAHWGASVLHPDCLAPVAAAGIPTRVRSTFHPESVGTLIDNRAAGGLRCAAVLHDLILLPEGWRAPQAGCIDCQTTDGSHRIAVPRQGLSGEYSGGIAAACVTAFGASEGQLRRIVRALHPLARVTHSPGAGFIVPEGQSQEAARRVHALLFGG